MPTIGLYGMTEVSANSTTWDLKMAKAYTAGIPIEGIDFKIDNPDKDGVGEICMRGRSSFLGYYKNEKATREVFDEDGYVHSGDLGKFNEGFLEITGRIKELIITAGGENIPPVLIEHTFKDHCPLVSNIMIIGDNRRFLSALMTLKVNMNPKDNSPTNILTNEFKIHLNNLVPEAKNVNTV
jgi:long-chain-fatty-acid--CoA ligase ACSBG